MRLLFVSLSICSMAIALMGRQWHIVESFETEIQRGNIIPRFTPRKLLRGGEIPGLLSNNQKNSHRNQCLRNSTAVTPAGTMIDLVSLDPSPTFLDVDDVACGNLNISEKII